MKKIVRRLTAILHQPSILPYYFLWLISSKRKAAVRVRCFSPLSFIQNWQSFSEYYSFRKGIPSRELVFFQSIGSSSDKEKVIIDVGANVGLFALAFADIFKDARVIAFEPSQRTYRRLQRNLYESGLMDNISLENIALSNAEGIARFLDNPDSPATNHLLPSQSESNSQDDSNYVTVECQTLDSYCENHSISHIDLLKIDVEGFECQVLQGARSMIQRKAVSWIFCELCPSNLAGVGSSVDRLWQTIASLELDAYKISASGGLALMSYDEFCESGLANIVLASRASVAESFLK